MQVREQSGMRNNYFIKTKTPVNILQTITATATNTMYIICVYLLYAKTRKKIYNKTKFYF